MAINPFRCKTEGWRRLSMVLAGIALVAWWLCIPVWIEANHYVPSLGPVLFTMIAPPLVVYSVIVLLRGVWLWVTSGFEADRDARQTRHSDPPGEGQNPRQG